ncbi:MAG: hypothetical protein Fur005_35050 [Roseiflexaceae bacterium]
MRRSRAKSAIEKLHAAKQPHVVSPIPPGFPGANQADSMVVSTPLEIDGLIRSIPPGKLITLALLRSQLARRHQTDIACPVSTAIFINVAAFAAEEYRAQGEQQVTPYWRVLRNGGKLNPKYPGGVAAQQALLEAEGFMVVQQGRELVVSEYQQHLLAV